MIETVRVPWPVSVYSIPRAVYVLWYSNADGPHGTNTAHRQSVL